MSCSNPGRYIDRFDEAVGGLRPFTLSEKEAETKKEEKKTEKKERKMEKAERTHRKIRQTTAHAQENSNRARPTKQRDDDNRENEKGGGEVALHEVSQCWGKFYPTTPTHERTTS